jgi:hypothetical protein
MKELVGLLGVRFRRGEIRRSADCLFEKMAVVTVSRVLQGSGRNQWFGSLDMNVRPEDVLMDRGRPFTGQEYLESLRDGREIWIYGERVEPM